MSRFSEVLKKSSFGDLVIKSLDRDLAKDMCIKNHYSHKWNSSFGTINFGIYREGELLGCAVFGNLMNPNSYKSISPELTHKSQIVELNRLWVDDKLGKNTESMFLSACFKLIKENHREVKLIQSFSDGRLGCGTIYKSANFEYYGYTESLFFEDIDSGEVFHKAPLEVTNRPKGAIEKNHRFVLGKLKPFKVRTYRYIYKINKYTQVSFKKQDYPTYHIGMEYLSDYKHSVRTVIRAWMLAFLLDRNETRDLGAWITKNIEEDDFNKIVKEYLQNKSILEVTKSRGCQDNYNKLCAKFGN